MPEEEKLSKNALKKQQKVVLHMRLLIYLVIDCLVHLLSTNITKWRECPHRLKKLPRRKQRKKPSRQLKRLR